MNVFLSQRPRVKEWFPESLPGNFLLSSALRPVDHFHYFLYAVYALCVAMRCCAGLYRLSKNEILEDMDFINANLPYDSRDSHGVHLTHVQLLQVQLWSR